MDNPVELAESALATVADSTDSDKTVTYFLAGVGTAIVSVVGVNYLRRKLAERKLNKANQENVVIETTAT